VNTKYVVAIETGAYQDLPGSVYARNFVKKYAQLLNVREETALELFNREYAVALKLVPPAVKSPIQPNHLTKLLSPRSIRRLVVLLLAVAVLVYLGIEIRNVTAAPTLAVTSPLDQLTTTERSVQLIGQTEPQVAVTVNGRTILVDRQGKFRDVFDLQSGLNTIVIRAVKKRGGSTTVVRKILVTTPTQ
jgi:cytoskeletal protein RodZ